MTVVYNRVALIGLGLIASSMFWSIRRGNLAISMAISLMFFVLYYILIVGGEQLADKNMFNPVLSMWLPNIIIFIVGLTIIKVFKN